MSSRDQQSFIELESPMSLVVATKCPEKWMLLDRETGQIYVGNNKGYWDKLERIIKKD